MAASTVDLLHAKVGRAKQHIQELDLAVRSFYDTKPYAIGIKEDNDAGQRVYCLRRVDDVPVSLATIAADILQNLRDPLDHIATDIITHEGTPPKKAKIYFPIAGSAADYPARRGGVIKGVRQEIIDAFDATEPYPGGKGHGLWQLNRLNRINKHSTLLVVGGYYEGVDIANPALSFFKSLDWWSDPDGKLESSMRSVYIRPADKLFPLKEGDELFREGLDAEVDEHRRFLFEIAFNAPGVVGAEPAIKVLHDLANLVDSVVVAFAPFLSP